MRPSSLRGRRADRAIPPRDQLRRACACASRRPWAWPRCARPSRGVRLPRRASANSPSYMTILRPLALDHRSELGRRQRRVQHQQVCAELRAPPPSTRRTRAVAAQDRRCGRPARGQLRQSRGRARSCARPTSAYVTAPSSSITAVWSPRRDRVYRERAGRCRAPAMQRQADRARDGPGEPDAASLCARARRASPLAWERQPHGCKPYSASGIAAGRVRYR